MKAAGSSYATEGRATRDLRLGRAHGGSSGISPDNVAGRAREFRCTRGRPVVPSLISARSVHAHVHRRAVGMESCHPQQVELHNLQPEDNYEVQNSPAPPI